MPIEKGLISYQDISFGTGTFQRKSQSGQLITLDQIRASHVPILDSANKFTGIEIETALAECLTKTDSGSTIRVLTNYSGAQRVAGDVVRVSGAGNNSFTTTTTSGDTRFLGVVLETINQAATGRVAVGGIVDTVRVDAATSITHYLKMSSTATKATPSTTLDSGCFGIALSGGSSTVSAYIFGVNYSAISSAIESKVVTSIGGTLTVPTSTWTTVVFATEYEDLHNDYATATGIFTVPEYGFYSLYANIQGMGYYPHTTYSLRFDIDGVKYAGRAMYSSNRLEATTLPYNGALNLDIFLSSISIAVSSPIFVEIYQNSGISLDIANSTNTRFEVTRIRA